MRRKKKRKKRFCAGVYAKRGVCGIVCAGLHGCMTALCDINISAESCGLIGWDHADQRKGGIGVVFQHIQKCML